MEVIIQKAVELGAAGVIPVATRNAVVKLDAKKQRQRYAAGRLLQKVQLSSQSAAISHKWEW